MPLKIYSLPAARSVLATVGLALAAQLTALPGFAQTTCNSDGVPAPTVLVERFTHADCASCWRDPATARPGTSELAIDWIVPSPKGEEAALSAAASRDALQRLEVLKQTLPAGTFNYRGATFHAAWASKGPPLKLRVAHGVALGGYLGASIELTRSGRAHV